MILLGSFGEGAGLDQLYVFLPLAMAGFVTFALLSVQWLVQLLGGPDHRSK